MLSNAAISRKYRELEGKEFVFTISDLCALTNGVGKGFAMSQDKTAFKVMRYLLDHFAVVLLSCATVIDPQVIILGGDASNFKEKDIILLKDRIEKHFPLAQNIIASKLNKNACLYGAIKMGLDRVEERIAEIW